MYAHRGWACRRITPLVGAAAALSALLLAGCTTQQADTSPLSTPSSRPSSDSESSPNTVDDEHEDHDHPYVPVPEANAGAQAEAINAAATVVTAFARPALSEQQWWNELLPLLSQKGAVAYEGTLPSNIPVTAVVGTPTVLEASTDVATLVSVPTDAGDYIVTLVRDSVDRPWLTERIRPAGQ